MVTDRTSQSISRQFASGNRLMITVVLIAVVLAGCGSSPDQSADATTTTDADQATDATPDDEGTDDEDPSDGETPSGDVDVPDEPIVVGVIMSLTGPFAPIGQTELQGIELAALQVNEAGGIEGRQIELVVLDDASDPTQSVTHVRTLIDDGVVAVLGPTAAPTVAQTTSITAREGVLQVLGVAQDAPGATTAQTIFGIPPSFSLWSEAAACYAQEVLGAETVGGIFSTDAAGQQTADHMVVAVEDRELDLVVTESVALDATDTSAQWSRIRDVQPDAAFNFVTGALGGQTLQAARDLGYEGPIIGYVAWGLPSILRLAGPAGDGVILAGHVSADDPAPHQEEFVAAFIEEFSAEDLNNYTAYGYDMMTVLIEALRVVPDATQEDGTRLAEALEQDVAFQGIVAGIDYGEFDPDDTRPHSAVTLQDVIFYEAEDAENGVLVRTAEQPDCS